MFTHTPNPQMAQSSRPKPNMRISMPATASIAMPQAPADNAVFVTNMPDNAPESLLHHMLAGVGPILSISRCSTGDKHAQIVIVFASPAAAQQAAIALEGNSIFGNTLGVTLGQVSTNTTISKVKTLDNLPEVSSQAQPGMYSKKNLYISNIPNDCTEQELLDAFSQFGTVDHVCILATVDAMGRRRAFIDMRSGAAARVAASNLHGSRVRGCTIDITFAHVQRSCTTGGNISPLFSPYSKTTAASARSVGSYFPETGHAVAIPTDSGGPTTTTSRQEQFTLPSRQTFFASTSSMSSQPPPPYDHPQSPQRLSRTLKVEHISQTAARDSLQLSKLFQPYGVLLDAQLVPNRNDADNAWGQVAFNQAEDAECARLDLDGRAIGGRNVKVSRLDDKWLVRAEVKELAQQIHPRRSAAISIRKSDGTPVILPSDSISNVVTPSLDRSHTKPSKASKALPLPQGDGAWPTMLNTSVAQPLDKTIEESGRPALSRLSVNSQKVVDQGKERSFTPSNSSSKPREGVSVPSFPPASYGSPRDYIRSEDDLSSIDDRLAYLAFRPFGLADAS